MPIIPILITIVIVGVILWAINKLIPMDPKVSMVLNVVAVIALLIWILQAFGVNTGLPRVR